MMYSPRAGKTLFPGLAGDGRAACAPRLAAVVLPKAVLAPRSLRNSRRLFMANLSHSAALLTDQVLHVLFVLGANVFEKLSVGQQFVRHRDRPRFCVSRGVINDDANVHVPKIVALEALGDVQGLSARVTAIVEPTVL